MQDEINIPSEGTDAVAGDEAAQMWAFSLEWWRSGRVEEICLGWQNRFACDVSFLLWTAWASGNRQCSLGSNDIKDALEHIAEWRDTIIDPARAARKGLRTTDPDLVGMHAREIYSGFRAVELKGEMREQSMLLDWLDGKGAADNMEPSIHSNMRHYIELLSDDLSAKDYENLEHIAETASAILRRIQA